MICWEKGMYGCPQAMIEREPVLDLLHRLRDLAIDELHLFAPALDEATALLREHGRLP